MMIHDHCRLFISEGGHVGMRRKRINLRRVLLCVSVILVISILLNIILLTVCAFGGKNDGVNSNMNSDVNFEAINGGNVGISDELRNRAIEIYNDNTELLVLVNKERELSDNYDAGLILICEGRLEASEVVYENLKDMLAAGDEKGYSFFIASAYRSAQRQQQLLDNDVDMYMNQGMDYDEALECAMEQVMPAGHSEHQTGLALDILTSDNLSMDESQADMPGNIWMRENCWKYGFILRYPKDKETSTGITYEPWHFRYVGKEAAKFITENEMTLEEFIEIACEGEDK